MAGEITRSGPRTDAWTAAIHATKGDLKPLGAGVVIDERRILTCAHVVRPGGKTRADLWVAFPKAGVPPLERRRVVEVATGEPADVVDVAVLVLDDPIPPGVIPAELRAPTAADIVGEPWWAFGFPDQDWAGSAAEGTVGAELGYGWVRLDTESRYRVEQGFSGGGLWSPRFGAVVGLVGQAKQGGDNRGDGRALTLYEADRRLDGQKLLTEWTLSDAGPDALAAWGWSLEQDPEAGRHWRPRARGVSVDSEGGYRFRGRTAALTAIVGWLNRGQPDRRALIVTGSPGVGKSAVLGRVVTTAEAAVRRSLPPDDVAVMARIDSVACAVHAKGKTALDVAMEVARAASVRIPQDVRELAPALRRALGERGGPFNIVVDALDEAASPADARSILIDIVVPIVHSCAEVGGQVVVGTRRVIDGAELRSLVGDSAEVVDLDTPEFFAEEDLEAYALATLQLSGAERHSNPYNDLVVAAPVAGRIARLADGNFLVAGLVAHSHGRHDMTAVPPESLTFTPTVDEAFIAYLDRLDPVESATAATVLTALAYAHPPGLSAELWSAALESFDVAVSAESLAEFAASSAANFLIESSGDRGARGYRLFHQALNDALLRLRKHEGKQQQDERAIVKALMDHGRRSGWATADSYLLRILPVHAERAEVIGELLVDDEYLLHADLLRLTAAADSATTATGKARARLLQLTPRAVQALPADRAALLSITEAVEQLGSAFAAGHPAPYRARWASVLTRAERAILEGHTGSVLSVCAVTVQGRSLLASVSDDGSVRLWDAATGQVERVLEGHTGSVLSVCAVTVQGRSLLASAGDDKTVRLWDPATGHAEWILEGHTGSVLSVCAVTVQGRSLLASASDDGTVRLWDAATEQAERVLKGHTGSVLSMCAMTRRGRSLLASASDDGTVRLWDAATGRPERLLEGHTAVLSVCEVTVQGRSLLALASDDGTVRLWDPVTWRTERVLDGHTGSVWSVCGVTVQGRSLLASASDDGTVRLWDPVTWRTERVLEGHSSVWSVCGVTVQGRSLLASASDDKTVRLWDAATGHLERILEGHTGSVWSVCKVTVQGRSLLASAGDDGAVRLWDAATGLVERVLEGHTGSVLSVCAVTVQGRSLLASAGDDGAVRLWDAATGQKRRRSLRAMLYVIWRRFGASARHTGSVLSVCVVTVQGRSLLASAGKDWTVRLWDAATGRVERVLEGHTDWVRSVCAVTVQGRSLLASASDDGTVRLWDPVTWRTERVLEGHTGSVWSVCAVTVQGRSLLASASDDKTVRLWDPATGLTQLVIPVHHAAYACAEVDGLLVVGLAAGILAIRVEH